MEQGIYGPYKKGDVLCVRTVTMHYIGRLFGIMEPRVLVFSEGGWLAESKRWSETLATGEVNEFELERGVFVVPLDVVSDVREWNHPIPKTQ